jgi:hypothetical protein
VVCGTIEEANVCVARPDTSPPAPLTRLLLQQEPTPQPTILHFDLRRGDAGFVDTTLGFQIGDSGGRAIAQPIAGPSRASIYLSRPVTGAITMVIEASATDTGHRTPVTVTLGDQSRVLSLGASVTVDTLHFAGDRAAQILQFTPGGDNQPARPDVPSESRQPVLIRIRRLTISLH